VRNGSFNGPVLPLKYNSVDVTLTPHLSIRAPFAADGVSSPGKRPIAEDTIDDILTEMYVREDVKGQDCPSPRGRNPV
jgi:hypothetical protein